MMLLCILFSGNKNQSELLCASVHHVLISARHLSESSHSEILSSTITKSSEIRLCDTRYPRILVKSTKT